MPIRHLAATMAAGLAATHALRIDINGVEQASWEQNQAAVNGMPAPVMHSFANHLHSVASLFSSILGSNGQQLSSASHGAPASSGSSAGVGGAVPGCFLKEDENSAWGDWEGPYCLISYDVDASCHETFSCHYRELESALPYDAKLCCRPSTEQWSEKFMTHKEHTFRVFLQGLPAPDGVAHMFEGHFGLTEAVFHARAKPENPLYINKFDLGAACKMWGEEYGYYSINPVPQGSYGTVQNSDETELSVCAMHRMYDQVSPVREVGSLMPFCTFKLVGQSFPEYAPLHLDFPKEQGHLPQDNLYVAETFLDTSGFCCSLTNHLTVDQTVVNLDYLPANWTMNDFQVIKWPYADCPVFEFPKMELTTYEIVYNQKQEYPWEFADLKMTMCAYRQPQVTDSSSDEEEAQIEELDEESEPEPEDSNEPLPDIKMNPQPLVDEGLISDDGAIVKLVDDIGSGSTSEEDQVEAAYQESLLPQLEGN